MSGDADGRTRVAVILGVAAVGVLMAMVCYLLYRAPVASEAEWTRSLYLFGAVEAVAFAAAGFFFGREVYRARLEEAERRLAGAAGPSLKFTCVDDGPVEP